jgi:hypothetical protein
MRLPRLLMALLATVALLGTPAAASAVEPDPAPYTTTLSIPGTTIVLSVGVTDGQLSTVNLDSGGAGTELVSGSSHAVTFLVDDGAAQVQIKAKHDEIETKVSAASLDDMIGTHSWEGELFGTGAGTTKVTFTITSDPSIADIAVGGLGTPEIGDVESFTDDNESGAKVRIMFTYDDGSPEGLTASIFIKVEVEADDGEQVAKLKISARSELIPPAGLSEVVIDGGTPTALPRCGDDHGVDDDEHGGYDDNDGHDGYDDDCDDHENFDDHEQRDEHAEGDHQEGDHAHDDD